MSNRPEPTIHIRLLGKFEVQRGEQVLQADDWPRRKAAALLKRLALERRLIKDRVMEFLWPESDPGTAANNLYKTIHVLRQTLNRRFGGDAAQAVFSFADGIFQLSPDVNVDVAEFERLCTPASGTGQEKRLASTELALGLYRGDLLPDDLYEEWTWLPRQGLQRLHREVRLELAASAGRRAEYSRSIALLQPLLEQDRLDEPVHRELMRLYARAGRRPEALRQYQACVEALAQELGVPPEAETDGLYAQILAGEVAPQPVELQTPAPLSQAPPAPGKPRPLFVGRERELRQLHHHLAAAAAGQGGVVFISGEAGQGKTSLMAEFAGQAGAAFPQLVAAAGSCQALVGVADPYLPFRELTALLSGDRQRPWLGGDLPPGLAERLEAAAPLTRRVMDEHSPGLLEVFGPPSGAALSPARPLHQPQIFDQFRQLIRFLASQRPLLLLLDDLQWIDHASANLLFYLARQLTNSPVLIVGAYRPSQVNRAGEGEHPLAAVVQELRRYLGEIQINLEDTRAGEARRWIDGLLDSEPNRLDASFREALYRRTGGHPLFTVELLRALQEYRHLVKDEKGRWTAPAGLDWQILPERVEAMVARRMEGLPPELLRLLAAASVEGETFSVEVLARVLHMDQLSLLRMLSGELDQRYRLVQEQGEWHLKGQTLARFQFRHNLFQQACYQSLAAAERKLLHGEVAAALEQLGAGDLDSLAVSLAHHFLAAGSPLKAVSYLCRSGDIALRRVALEEAARFYLSALEHWQEPAGVSKAGVLHRLGEALLALGRSLEALERFSEADLEYARNESRTGRGAVQRLMGRSCWELGDRARALEHYHRAIALLEQEPPGAEMARAVSALAQMHMLADEFDEAIAWGERALSAAQDPEMEDVTLHTRVSLGVAWVAKGEGERGLEMLRASLERAQALGLPHDAGRAYTGLGDCLVSLERYDEARQIYEGMLAYSQKVQAGLFEGAALVQLGYLDWWAGRWRVALQRRTALLEWRAAFPGALVAKVWASTLLAGMDNDLGLPEKACRTLAEFTAVARSAHELQTTVPFLGQMIRCTASPAEIPALAREILDLAAPPIQARYDALPALRLASCWLAQTTGGDPQALALLERAHRQIPNLQMAAVLDEARACAAEVRQDWQAAVSACRAAAAGWKALRRPYDELRTLASLLSAARRLPASPDSSRQLQQAHHRAEGLVEQLAAELDEESDKKAFLASPLVRKVGAGSSSRQGSAF